MHIPTVPSEQRKVSILADSGTFLKISIELRTLLTQPPFIRSFLIHSLNIECQFNSIIPPPTSLFSQCLPSSLHELQLFLKIYRDSHRDGVKEQGNVFFQVWYLLVQTLPDVEQKMFFHGFELADPVLLLDGEFRRGHHLINEIAHMLIILRTEVGCQFLQDTLLSQLANINTLSLLHRDSPGGFVRGGTDQFFWLFDGLFSCFIFPLGHFILLHSYLETLG